jgi:hypothetical protein
VVIRMKQRAETVFSMGPPRFVFIVECIREIISRFLQPNLPAISALDDFSQHESLRWPRPSPHLVS